MSKDVRVNSSGAMSLIKIALRSRLFFSVLVFLFSALLVRLWLVLTAAGSIEFVALVRGVAFDLLVVIIASLIIEFLPSFIYKFVLSATHLFFSCLYYGNYEHILANGDAILPRDLLFMLSPEFRAGSGTSVSNPFLFGLMILLPLVVIYCYQRRFRSGFPTLALGFGLLIVVGATACSIPDDLNRREWEQSNVLVLFVWDGVLSFVSAAPSQIAKPKDSLIRQYSEPDLLGRAIVRAPGNDPVNVLLVMIEGISGTDVYPDYSKYLPKTRKLMPEFRKIAKRGLSYPHTISLQRKTNRGMWTILCGQLPNLQSIFPKIDYAQRLQEILNIKCLAHHLADAGYKTVYLQAADLKIMQKDRHLPELGFQHVHGIEWFKQPYFNTGWGPSDNHFLEQTVRMVRSLEADDKPWFLTLLTSGTHHPYKVPPGFNDKKLEHRERAVRVADSAIGAFIEELDRMGVLDSTLVVITADESFGAGRNTPKIYENWVPLVVLEPSARVKEISTSFALSDLHLSILDYLAIEQISRPPAGRSIFRSYLNPRPIVFANAYARRIYQFTENNQLLQCANDFSQCHVREYKNSTFMWDKPDDGVIAPAEASAELKSLVSWNDWDHHRLRILRDQGKAAKSKKVMRRDKLRK